MRFRAFDTTCFLSCRPTLGRDDVFEGFGFTVLLDNLRIVMYGDKISFRIRCSMHFHSKRTNGSDDDMSDLRLFQVFGRSRFGGVGGFGGVSLHRPKTGGNPGTTPRFG